VLVGSRNYHIAVKTVALACIVLIGAVLTAVAVRA
jgi:hypothetical protein